MKCSICGSEIFRGDEWIWQPFGPAESSMSLSLPGNHYRGFPAIKICNDCEDTLHVTERGAGGPVHFVYKGIHFIFDGKNRPVVHGL